MVPGANPLAEVAAEDPIPNIGAQIQRNDAFVFDCQIGDAAAAVDGAVGKDAGSGTDLQAASAAAAVVGGEGRVWL